ncbi:hypothetical protein F4678DRAFT_433821 [Xylaria arbuscula]|nr:hypothetical protein F4678DRAFT_433821 [Xylaria arbuscula]
MLYRTPPLLLLSVLFLARANACYIMSQDSRNRSPLISRINDNDAVVAITKDFVVFFLREHLVNKVHLRKPTPFVVFVLLTNSRFALLKRSLSWREA